MQQTGASALSGLEHLYYAQNAGLGLPAQQTTIINCPKKMVGRVIGKNGETIKALQQFTGAQIQIDQRCDPTRVSIAGSPKSLQVASSMVQDIVAGTFKGFAMLRSFATQAAKAPDALSFASQPIPVYIEGYGFVPPSQFYDPLDTAMPAYQHNLHAFSPDPGVYGADNGNLQALSLAIAAQARMLETRDQSPAPELRTQSPGFNNSPYFQTLAQVHNPHLQQQQPQQNGSHHHQQQHAAQHYPHNFTTRALFPSDEYDIARGGDKLQASPLNSSLPSLSTSSVTPSSQANGLTVWSQLEKLSPDGVPVSGSPLLTPVHTPSRSSSPITKAVHGAAQHVLARDSLAGSLRAEVPLTSSPSDLLAQLQSLSIGRDPNAAPEPNVSAASFYSSGWPASSAPATPSQPPPGSAWMSMLDPEKRRFYHNWQTGQSQYEKPESWVANDVLVGGYQNGSSAKQALPKLF